MAGSLAKFEQKEQHDKEQIKTVITSSTNNNTQELHARLVSQFIVTKIGYHFSDYKKNPLLIPRFLKFPSFV